MPTISIFFGIVVQMYWNDHAPPHVHAFYQGHKGYFRNSDGHDDRWHHASRWATHASRVDTSLHSDELKANWERGRLHEPFQTIRGADEE